MGIVTSRMGPSRMEPFGMEPSRMGLSLADSPRPAAAKLVSEDGHSEPKSPYLSFANLEWVLARSTSTTASLQHLL